MTKHEPVPSPDGVAIHRMGADEFILFSETAGREAAGRLELWDGVIIEMASEGPLHMRLVQRLTLALTRFLISNGFEERLGLSPNGSLLLGPRFVLQPDVMIGPVLDGKTLPGPSDIVLAVEASVTTQAYDFGDKLAKYAESGVRELWILDDAQALHRFRDPQPHGYLDRTKFKPGDRIAPDFAGGADLAVTDLF